MGRGIAMSAVEVGGVTLWFELFRDPERSQNNWAQTRHHPRRAEIMVSDAMKCFGLHPTRCGMSVAVAPRQYLLHLFAASPFGRARKGMLLLLGLLAACLEAPQAWQGVCVSG
jgi:hypothetical protein